MEVEGANSACSRTVGCTENLPLQVGDVTLWVHTHVVQDAPFQLLLGHLFQHAVLCCIEDLPLGEVEVSILDLADRHCRVYLPFHPCKGRSHSLRILTILDHTTPNHMDPLGITPTPSASSLLFSLPPLSSPAMVLAYKKVAQKVHPIPASLPKDFRNLQHIPVNPLLSLLPLPTHPPDFTPSIHLTQEHLNTLNLNPDGFL